MTKTSIIAAITTLVFICSVGNGGAFQASDIDGKWSGKIPLANNKSLEIAFEFRVNGKKLEGEAFNSGQAIPLVEGQVKGSSFSFKVEGEKPEYTGTIKSNEIQNDC